MRLVTFALLLSCSLAFAQKKISNKAIEKAVDEFVTPQGVEADLRFLAADEMRGRDTGSPELNIAANYIMTQFMKVGVLPGDGQSYFQPVSLVKSGVPSKVELVLEANGARGTVPGLLMQGNAANLSRPVVFVGYGASADFDKVDVKDKIVVSLFGAQGSSNVSEGMYSTAPAKRSLALKRGAVALVEIMALPGVPWGALTNYFSKPRVAIQSEELNIPHVLVQSSEDEPLKSLFDKRAGEGTLLVQATAPIVLNTKNVVGIIRGSDAKLREEYVAVTAHYDHVGVAKTAGQDSIFNGARDNAIGTTALLETARFFSRHPPRRSILLIAFTGEEKGLLGSHWYADHPVVPLKQTVFDLNCDGAGYNDMTIATVIDFNRTTADDLLKRATAASGLELKGDPAPEQGLFDRSDNVNFAKKGVPACNLSPGVKAFDQELMKYYHQPADEVSTLDMAYLTKFYRVMLRSILFIGNAPEAPTWKAGDKYEAAGKALYAR